MKRTLLNVQNTKEKPTYIKDIVSNFRIIGTKRISYKLSEREQTSPILRDDQQSKQIQTFLSATLEARKQETHSFKMLKKTNFQFKIQYSDTPLFKSEDSTEVLSDIGGTQKFTSY